MSSELTTWEKLKGFDWRGETKAGRHGASCNAAALQAWPFSSPVATEWPAACWGGPGRPTAAGAQSRHQHPQCWFSVLAAVPGEVAGSPGFWECTGSLLGLGCPSGESHGPGEGGGSSPQTCLRGGAAWKEAGSRQSRSDLLEGVSLAWLARALPGRVWSNRAHAHPA